MYEDLIKRINPRPKFNLKWYKQEDLYSEGEIEDTLIQMIAENEPENYVDAIYDEYCWSTYYHLTHVRKNILNWYPFEKTASVLEIGCGLGAITNMLCENCGDVTAVELSQKRATAALLRCREQDNLEIIVGNLNDIEFEKKFDYITLIGVLEYQGQYTDTDNPYEDFLKTIKTLLKPDGKLLIAIENKYGLKYWCGAPEDHTGIPFDGMNQYEVGNHNARTFSKKELDELVRNSGFKNTFFYYPLPDYKLPTVVYSQGHLPSNDTLQNMRIYYTNQNTLVANEYGIYQDVIDNGVFEFFANSFLVECSDADDVGKVSFASMSCERAEQYRIYTRIRGEAVDKGSLSDKMGNNHIEQTLQNQSELEQAGLHVVKTQKSEAGITSPYVHAQLLEDRMLQLYKAKDIEGIYELFDRVYQEIVNSSEHAEVKDNVLYALGIDTPDSDSDDGPILKKAYLDMILRNAFWIDNEIYWFDQEWALECVPAKCVMHSVISEFYLTGDWLEKILPMSSVAGHFGIVPAWQKYNRLRELFFASVLDKKHIDESWQLCDIDKSVYSGNIAKLFR